MSKLPGLAFSLLFSAALLVGQGRPTGTEYHTMYISANRALVYGESSLETSTMNIPPGTTIVHTVTAAFSLQAGSGGSKTHFSVSQQGGPQQSLDPVDLGDIPWTPDQIDIQVLDDTAVCNYFGNFFDDEGTEDYAPPPEITALQNYNQPTNSYTPFAPLVGTPQSAGNYMLIYGEDLTAAGLTNPPEICINNSGCSSGGAISVSGFHLGSGWAVTDGQINIPVWVDPTATAGSYSLSLQTEGGTASTIFVVSQATPVITSISPDISLIGASNVALTISGANFGTIATVNLPAGITSAGGQTTSPTSISISVNLANTASIGLNNITVTSGGLTSAAKSFTVNGPTTLTVLTDVAGLCAGCKTTIQRLTTYTVKNFDNSAAGALPICETPTWTGWSCTQGVTYHYDPCTVVATQPAPGTVFLNAAGQFTDQWTLGSDVPTPIGCGTNISDHWYWYQSAAKQFLLGSPLGYIRTNAISLDGWVTTLASPQGLPSGTIITH